MKFSDRQQAIIDGLMHGDTYTQIGHRLGVSRQCICAHLYIVARKWGIDTSKFTVRTRIVFLESRRLGLIPEWEEVA